MCVDDHNITFTFVRVGNFKKLKNITKKKKPYKCNALEGRRL